MTGAPLAQQLGMLLFDKALIGLLLLLGAHILGRKLERFKSGLAREMELERQRVAAAREALEALLALDAALVNYRNSRIGVFDPVKDPSERQRLHDAIGVAGTRISATSLVLPGDLVERTLLACSAVFDFINKPLAWTSEVESNASTMAVEKGVMEAADEIRRFVQRPIDGKGPVFGPVDQSDARWNPAALTKRLAGIRDRRTPEGGS